MYRGFYKNLNNLAGNSISSADLRIQSMNIKKDILTLTTSDFVVVKIPEAFQEGNLFGVYDDYGQTVYIGIIKSLENNRIQCEDIISLFNDEWRYSNPTASTVETKIRSVIVNNLGNSSDNYLKSIFSAFNVTTLTSTPGEWESKDGTVNLMNFLFDVYRTSGILLDINVFFNAIAPTIKIGKPNYPTIKLSNNVQMLRNFDITTETQEVNKLEIYNADGSQFRSTYYATESGITTDSSVLNRLPKIKTKIIFSDDELVDIVANNLTSDMFNHKITVELILQNKLYDFNEFHLGQSFEIYYNGKIYESILTGYAVTVHDAGQADKVKLTFGKVRQTLESKIQAISAEVFQKKVEQKDVPTFDNSYKPGDTLRLNFYGIYVGVLTSGQREIGFTLFLDKPIDDSVTGISIGSIKCNLSAYGNVYLGRGSSWYNDGYEYVGVPGYEVKVNWKAGLSAITIWINKSSAYTSTTALNNSAVIIRAQDLIINFS